MSGVSRWPGWVMSGWVVSGLLLGLACGGPDSSTSTSPFVPSGVTSDSMGSGDGPDPSTADASGTGGTGDPTSPGDDTSSGGDPTASTAADATADGTTGDSDFDGEPGEFTLSFDGRDYRLYVPSGYAHGAAIPLLVGFHGAGDTGGNFYAFAAMAGLTAAAEPAAYVLVVPDTKSPYSDFANWSGNPQNDVDAMIAEMDEILALIDDVGTHYHVDLQQLHPFGFSNGGLFTALTGMARADRFATLTVLGYGWGAFYLPPGAPSRTIPVQLGCGSGDGFYAGAQASEAFLAGQGHDTRLVTAAGVGHSFAGIMGTLTPADMFAWMQARPLP